MKSQNTSHAVMAQRREPNYSLDNFPTPPWGTRALLSKVLGDQDFSALTCLEPACGAGHMAKVLPEFFKQVLASDIYPYGFGSVRDFLGFETSHTPVDWVITNPPFRLAEAFAVKGLEITTLGVALLTRTVFLESVGRYKRLFTQTPPTLVAQFSERVPMVKARLDRKATTATGYAWLVWRKDVPFTQTELRWIPPCRKELERDEDYQEVFSSQTRPPAEDVSQQQGDLL